MKTMARPYSACLVIYSLLLPAVAKATFPTLELAPRVIAEEVLQPGYPNINAVAVAVGEASLYPSVGLSLGSIDNVYYDVEGDDALESSVVSLRPRADLIALGAKRMLWLSYFGNYATHRDAESADFDDHRLSLVSHTSFDSRKRLDLEASIAQSHYDIGTVRTSTFNSTQLRALEEVDVFRQNKAGASFSYGNRDTRGEIVLGYASGAISFTSNEAQTSQYDRDFSVAWSRLYFRLSPQVRIFGNLAYRIRDYDIAFESDGLERDSSTETVSTGIVWNVSTLWSGYATVASNRLDYDDDAISDADSVFTDLGISWSIRSYSRLRLSLSQQEYESTRSDGLVDVTSFSVRWLHDWNNRLSSAINFQAVSELEDNSSLDTDYSQSEVEIRFAPRRWLKFLAGYSTNRLSKPAGDADRSLFYLGAEANF